MPVTSCWKMLLWSLWWWFEHYKFGLVVYNIDLVVKFKHHIMLQYSCANPPDSCEIVIHDIDYWLGHHNLHTINFFKKMCLALQAMSSSNMVLNYASYLVIGLELLGCETCIIMAYPLWLFWVHLSLLFYFLKELGGILYFSASC